MHKINPWSVLCEDDVKDVKGHIHAGEYCIDFFFSGSAFIVIMNLGKRRKMIERNVKLRICLLV